METESRKTTKLPKMQEVHQMNFFDFLNQPAITFSITKGTPKEIAELRLFERMLERIERLPEKRVVETKALTIQ